MLLFLTASCIIFSSHKTIQSLSMLKNIACGPRFGLVHFLDLSYSHLPTIVKSLKYVKFTVSKRDLTTNLSRDDFESDLRFGLELALLGFCTKKFVKIRKQNKNEWFYSILFSLQLPNMFSTVPILKIIIIFFLTNKMKMINNSQIRKTLTV